MELEVEENGKESTYTWSKEDFYLVDTPSNKIDPGHPLNTISINKKIGKYFTDITKEDKSDVVTFISKNV